MTTTCYEIGNDDDKSDNNEDKVCLLLIRWGWVGHVLDHVLDHMIIDFVTTALQLSSSLGWASMNK